MIDRISHWFNDDYPPLDGRIRFLFYGLLLPLGHKQLLIQTPTELLRCPQELYHPEGLFALLLGSSHSVEFIFSLLMLAKYPFLLTWCFCIFGFGGWINRLIHAIFTFIFWGTNIAITGTGHFWHIPMYAFFILALTLRNDSYSLDSFLSKKHNSYSSLSAKNADFSPFGRKLILLTIVFVFFSAGISKLTLGGIKWLNGDSLYFYVKYLNRPRFRIGEALFQFLIAHKPLFKFLSWLTICFEIGSILAIIYSKIRTVFIFLAIIFHIGILLVLAPIYIPQMICYLLIIDHSEYLKLFNKSLLLRTFDPTYGQINMNNQLSSKKKWATSLVGTSFILTLLIVMIRQKEWFPFTHVPMYSTVIDGDQLSALKFSDLNNLEGLSKVASAIQEDEYPDLVPYLLDRKCLILKVNNRNGINTNYLDPMLDALPNRSLWSYSLAKNLAKDIQDNKSLSSLSTQPTFPNTQIIFQASIEKSLEGTVRNSGEYTYKLIYQMLPKEKILLAEFTP